MKHCLLGFFCLTFIATSFAQNTIDKNSLRTAHKAQLIEAQNYLYGKGVEQNYKKAYKIYLKLSKEENSYALNALGMMRQNGLGVEKNDTLALRYFYKSAQKGNGKAAYNIGIIYKEGDGFEQNFERAFQWFETSERLGYPKGYYGTGYAYYKGFGVEQSYENAVEKFLKGAEKGDASCMFFLALCYKNGFGVEKNQEQSNLWLNQSAEKGSVKAQRLLSKIKERNSSSNLRLKSASADADTENAEFNIENLKAYRQSKESLPYEGTWVGTLYTLDWSGKQILKTVGLKLELNAWGDRIYGEWIENDTISTSVEGTLVDSLIVFENTEISKVYQQKQDRLQMEKASFKLNTETMGKSLLLGNMSLYSTGQKEPYRPNIIHLEKVISQNSGIAEIETNKLNLYPNPVTDYLYLECGIDKEQNITVEIYNAAGNLTDKHLCEVSAGENKISLPVSHLVSGIYVVRITGNGLLYSTSVVKK